jgi:hypothetical protein
LERFLFVALLGAAAVAIADGPGSQIRGGPSEPPRPSPAAQRDLDRCAAMRTEDKERCLKNLRAAAAADEKQRGPGATSGGVSAGAGGTTGTTTK